MVTPGQYGGLGTDPGIFADTDGGGQVVGALRRVLPVVDGGEHHMGADQRPIPDIDAALILKMAATVNKDVFADVDIFAALRVKRRKQGEAFIDLLPGQPGKSVRISSGS